MYIKFSFSLRVTTQRGVKEGTQSHNQDKSLDLLIGDEPVLRRGIQFETPLTEVADEGTGQQSHAGDGQQLQQPLPGEQVVQRRHLGQHDACLDADEVVRQEACGKRSTTHNCSCSIIGGFILRAG